MIKFDNKTKRKQRRRIYEIYTYLHEMQFKKWQMLIPHPEIDFCFVIICYSHFLWLCDKLLKHHKIGESDLSGHKKYEERNVALMILSLSQRANFTGKVTKKPIQKRTI